jgi:hypothetical protein
MLHRREFMQASAGAIAAVGLPGAARAAAWKTIDAQVHCYEQAAIFKFRHSRSTGVLSLGPVVLDFSAI